MFLLENCELKISMFFQETFDTNHYYYHDCYCKFIDCRQKKILDNLEKEKLIKTSRKRQKIMYLYKSINIFFVMFKILSKLQELSCEKIN